MIRISNLSLLTSTPLASLIILRFWQRQYKFKHGTNIDRHPFKQSVCPAFAAVWPEIRIMKQEIEGLNGVKMISQKVNPNDIRVND